MAKFYGVVGYANTEPDPSSVDVWKSTITEHNYYGDVFEESRRLEKGISVNDNVNVSHRISIVADAFAYDHIFAIRYVEWMGTRWKVTDVKVQRPRLILSIGGVYNGPTVDDI